MTTRTDILEQERIKRTFCDYRCSPRMAWNSGFWDGHGDAKNRWPRRHEGSAVKPLPAWSPFYAAGYRAGFEAFMDDGFDGGRSSEYWHGWRDAQSDGEIRSLLRREDGWK